MNKFFQYTLIILLIIGFIMNHQQQMLAALLKTPSLTSTISPLKIDSHSGKILPTPFLILLNEESPQQLNDNTSSVALLLILLNMSQNNAHWSVVLK